MTKANKHHSPIARMIKTRSLSIYQAIAFEELAALLEIHERGTYVRTSTVLRVREPAGPKAIDVGRRNAHLAQIEAAFTTWEREMGASAAIAVDFARGSLTLQAVASKHRMRFDNAKDRLLAALDRWTEIRQRGIVGEAPTGF